MTYPAIKVGQVSRTDAEETIVRIGVGSVVLSGKVSKKVTAAPEIEMQIYIDKLLVKPIHEPKSRFWYVVQCWFSIFKPREFFLFIFIVQSKVFSLTL